MKYSDAEIKESLEGYVPLENYFIYRDSYILGSGMINFLTPDGKVFIDKISDDVFHDACVDYYIEFGVPVPL